MNQVQDYLSEVEATSSAGQCVVCWHELKEPVPASTDTPHYLHAAFYSFVCRVWWLCAEHEAAIEDIERAPHTDCKCSQATTEEYQR